MYQKNHTACVIPLPRTVQCDTKRNACAAAQPVLRALDEVARAMPPGHVLLVGIDANTLSSAGAEDAQSVPAFCRFLGAVGLASLWGTAPAGDARTTCTSRTYLQTQVYIYIYRCIFMFNLLYGTYCILYWWGTRADHVHVADVPADAGIHIILYYFLRVLYGTHCVLYWRGTRGSRARR
jgi:hypothetical protein